MRGDAWQRVIAEAVTRATAPLRAENARLRAEVQRLRAELTVPPDPALDTRPALGMGFGTRAAFCQWGHLRPAHRSPAPPHVTSVDTDTAARVLGCAPRTARAVLARIAAHTGEQPRRRPLLPGAALRASVPSTDFAAHQLPARRDRRRRARCLTTTATSPRCRRPSASPSVPSLIAPAPRGATGSLGRSPLADTPAMSAHGTGSKIPPTLLPVLFDLSQSLHQARAACGTTTSSRRG